MEGTQHSAPLSSDHEEVCAGKAPSHYLDMMAHEELSESEERGAHDVLFDRPDVGRYFDMFELTPQAKIALARTYANYLAAQLPESAARAASRKRSKVEKK